MATTRPEPAPDSGQAGRLLGRSCCRVGCAGWSIPAAYRDRFAREGTHLERYASRLPAVEINSSFYRSHRRSTYERWAASVAPDFMFSVKVPKAITHIGRLRDISSLDQFLSELSGLGEKLGPLLVQLPPSLSFDHKVVHSFFGGLRDRFSGSVVCEPRHASWFSAEADGLLAEFRVARVAADPAVAPSGGLPGGWDGLVYLRLHGVPRMYYSAYSDERLESVAANLAGMPEHLASWCIFDNTARGAATDNALGLLDRLEFGARLR